MTASRQQFMLELIVVQCQHLIIWELMNMIVPYILNDLLGGWGSCQDDVD